MTTPTRLALSPLVAAAIARSPKCGVRAFKGSELLANGKVQRLADAPLGVDRWLVYGSGDQPYRVSVAADTCTCPDRAQACKHLHAARFALALGVPAPVEIAPAQPQPDPDPDLWAAAPVAEEPAEREANTVVPARE